MSKQRKIANHIIESAKDRDIKSKQIQFKEFDESKLSSNQIKK